MFLPKISKQKQKRFFIRHSVDIIDSRITIDAYYNSLSSLHHYNRIL